MRILITGCGGMLGEAVYAELKDKYTVYATDIDLNEDWLGYLDVRSTEQVNKYFKTIEPSAVLHLAALTDMEYCELNPTHAYDVNFMGTHNVVQAANRHDIQVVYISSAGVFDGKKQIYDESDIPNPLNVYAQSKYAGELAALIYPGSTIIRAGWMMGGGPKKDKKFVNKIIKQIRSGAKELFVVQDKLGTPTYTYELANTIRHFVEYNILGTYHGACDGSGSRVDVAKEIVKDLGLSDHITIKIVNSSHFKKEYFAKRPYSEKLVSIRNSPWASPSWQDCLKDYLNKFEWKI